MLTNLGRFDEAEPLLLESYEKRRDNPQTHDIREREALERIVKLYETWARPDKAAEWRAKLPERDDKPKEPVP